MNPNVYRDQGKVYRKSDEAEIVDYDCDKSGYPTIGNPDDWFRDDEAWYLKT